MITITSNSLYQQVKAKSIAKNKLEKISLINLLKALKYDYLSAILPFLNAFNYAFYILPCFVSIKGLSAIKNPQNT